MKYYFEGGHARRRVKIMLNADATSSKSISGEAINVISKSSKIEKQDLVKSDAEWDEAAYLVRSPHCQSRPHKLLQLCFILISVETYIISRFVSVISSKLG